jgi:hypothetical protein
MLAALLAAVSAADGAVSSAHKVWVASGQCTKPDCPQEFVSLLYWCRGYIVDVSLKGTSVEPDADDMAAAYGEGTTPADVLQVREQTAMESSSQALFV